MSDLIWQPKGRAPERLLIYGPQGAGKTRAVMDVAEKCVAAGQTMYVIDTDNSYTRFLEADGCKVGVRAEWEGGEWVDDFTDENGRMVLLHVRGWEEFAWAMRYCWGEARRGDWVVVDSLTHPWQDIQTWYIERVHGTELPEFLIEARIKQVENDKGADGGASAMLVEWAFVNKTWSATFLTPFVNARCHTIVTAEAKQVRTDDRGDSRDIRDLYGTVGMKPDSQRRIGANAQTVLYMEKARGRDAGWVMQTVKDREREWLERTEVEDSKGFTKQYMQKVAGWRPRKEG